jgi:hypothetical protein
MFRGDNGFGDGSSFRAGRVSNFSAAFEKSTAKRSTLENGLDKVVLFERFGEVFLDS